MFCPLNILQFSYYRNRRRFPKKIQHTILKQRRKRPNYLPCSRFFQLLLFKYWLFSSRNFTSTQKETFSILISRFDVWKRQFIKKNILLEILLCGRKKRVLNGKTFKGAYSLVPFGRQLYRSILWQFIFSLDREDFLVIFLSFKL